MNIKIFRIKNGQLMDYTNKILITKLFVLVRFDTNNSNINVVIEILQDTKFRVTGRSTKLI
jgi:hypothetical protein